MLLVNQQLSIHTHFIYTTTQHIIRKIRKEELECFRNLAHTVSVYIYSLLDEELEQMKQHSVVGYRILSLFDDTLDLAEYVYGHHERWDGNGYPRKLEGEQIPLLSRIITVVEIYDRVLNRGELPLEERKRVALDVIKNGAGTQFDPQIAELFVQMTDN